MWLCVVVMQHLIGLRLECDDALEQLSAHKATETQLQGTRVFSHSQWSQNEPPIPLSVFHVSSSL